jgi:hypothetical protein
MIGKNIIIKSLLKKLSIDTDFQLNVTLSMFAKLL